MIQELFDNNPENTRGVIPRTASGQMDAALTQIYSTARKGEPPAAPSSHKEDPCPPQAQPHIARNHSNPHELAPITLTLLNLAPPVIVATACFNFIERLRLPASAKTFLYTFALVATHQSFHYTGSLLHAYKMNEQRPADKAEPRHFDLGRTHRQ